jgi:tetraacyldisaccharide 4'-kinase
MRLIERIWFGDSIADRAGRAALLPLEGVYRGIVGIRGKLYDRGLLHSEGSAIPVVSVGNITVGGTGKTPVAAWIASRLLSAGRKPAIVLRGYGNDEPLVHERLNPDVPVIVDPDRVSGISRAVVAGADIAVLDDAFQHRRAKRDEDIVLLSADNWADDVRALPAGPFREPANALKRASVIVITRKAASDQLVSRVENMTRRHAPDVPTAVVRLVLSEVIQERDRLQRMPVTRLAGKRVLALAALGNPEAFFAQLEAVGAIVTPWAFPDHHAFTRADVDVALSLEHSVDLVVCTLKDAVKLGRSWPDDRCPLWYVSLAILVERGDSALDSLLMRLDGRIGVK